MNGDGADIFVFKIVSHGPCDHIESCFAGSIRIESSRSPSTPVLDVHADWSQRTGQIDHQGRVCERRKKISGQQQWSSGVDWESLLKPRSEIAYVRRWLQLVSHQVKHYILNLLSFGQLWPCCNEQLWETCRRCWLSKTNHRPQQCLAVNTK